jgi:purine-binding chemotaxis protein CheW
MDANSKQCHTQARKPLTLEALIAAIDRRMDDVPSPYAAEGLAGFSGNQAQAHRQQERHYIRFLLDSTAFAFPLQNALEIDYVPNITPLPNLPQWVLGICNLRGDIVSVIDLKQVLQLTPKGAKVGQKLILIRNEDTSTAIMVDKVAGMRRWEDENSTDTKEAMKTTAFAPFVDWVIDIDGQSVHLLNVDALMKAIEI